MGQYKINKIK